MRPVIPLSVPAILLFCFGCASSPGPENSLITPADITVLADNRNFNDANIYATDGERRVRVGRVTGKTTEEFTFKWYQPQIRMLVDFTGVDGRPLVSQFQIVVPGEIDEFLLVIGVSPNGPITLTGR